MQIMNMVDNVVSVQTAVFGYPRNRKPYFVKPKKNKLFLYLYTSKPSHPSFLPPPQVKNRKIYIPFRKIKNFEGGIGFRSLG